MKHQPTSKQEGDERTKETKPPFATSATLLPEQMQFKEHFIISFIGKSKEKIPLEIVNLQTINNIV